MNDGNAVDHIGSVEVPAKYRWLHLMLPKMWVWFFVLSIPMMAWLIGHIAESYPGYSEMNLTEQRGVHWDARILVVGLFGVFLSLLPPFMWRSSSMISAKVATDLKLDDSFRKSLRLRLLITPWSLGLRTQVTPKRQRVMVSPYGNLNAENPYWIMKVTQDFSHIAIEWAPAGYSVEREHYRDLGYHVEDD